MHITHSNFSLNVPGKEFKYYFIFVGKENVKWNKKKSNEWAFVAIYELIFIKYKLSNKVSKVRAIIWSCFVKNPSGGVVLLTFSLSSIVRVGFIQEIIFCHRFYCFCLIFFLYFFFIWHWLQKYQMVYLWRDYQEFKRLMNACAKWFESAKCCSYSVLQL